MSWRAAGSLLRLRAQVDEAWPARSRASDGTIGDAAHASSSSDHNPWVQDGGVGVVTALDLTHDPAHGVDCGQIAAAIVAARDPRVKYMIFNRKIVSSSLSPWNWRPYYGSNLHTAHLHVSVHPTKALYDSSADWDVGLKKEEDVPDWFESWFRWYLLDRRLATRPDAPLTIPEWAWELVAIHAAAHLRDGPPALFLSWAAWYVFDRAPETRPVGVLRVYDKWWSALSQWLAFANRKVDAAVVVKVAEIAALQARVVVLEARLASGDGEVAKLRSQLDRVRARLREALAEAVR